MTCHVTYLKCSSSLDNVRNYDEIDLIEMQFQKCHKSNKWKVDKWNWIPRRQPFPFFLEVTTATVVRLFVSSRTIKSRRPVESHLNHFLRNGIIGWTRWTWFNPVNSFKIKFVNKIWTDRRHVHFRIVRQRIRMEAALLAVGGRLCPFTFTAGAVGVVAVGVSSGQQQAN